MLSYLISGILGNIWTISCFDNEAGPGHALRYLPSDCLAIKHILTEYEKPDGTQNISNVNDGVRFSS